MLRKINGSIIDFKFWERILDEKNKMVKLDIGRTQEEIYDQAKRTEFILRVEKRQKKLSRRKKTETKEQNQIKYFWGNQNRNIEQKYSEKQGT